MTHLQLLPSYGKEQYQQLNIKPVNTIKLTIIGRYYLSY